MTTERAEALDNIGFNWKINPEFLRDDKAWQRRYHELKDFKARTGHCWVPWRYNENKALGVWVRN